MKENNPYQIRNTNDIKYEAEAEVSEKKDCRKTQ